jgi:hypothetical protein
MAGAERALASIDAPTGELAALVDAIDECSLDLAYATRACDHRRPGS